MTLTSPVIYGVELPEALRRVGSARQFARIDQFVETQGPGCGARRIVVTSASGLSVELHPDRALDIGAVSYRGMQISWLSPTGIAAPGLTVDRDYEWLRTFGGGLLTTCGLEAFGPPSESDGVHYPMHGRISTIPATVTRAEATETHLIVEGELRQARVFGENFVLRRKISVAIDTARIVVEDHVTNEARTPVGHMVLYHCNLGWPLIDHGATLSLPSNSVEPRDASAEQGFADWAALSDPIAGYAEQVFRHDFTDRGIAEVSVNNVHKDLRLTMRFDSATLPGLHQWKMMDEVHYVLGLEPTNANWSSGRVAAEAQGTLPMLAAGESVTYRLEFEFAPAQPEQAPRTEDV